MTLTASVTSHSDIALQLDGFAQDELNELSSFLDKLAPYQCGIILIEACRCLDQLHITRSIEIDRPYSFSYPDFDIIVRGWNVLFSLLLTRKGSFDGIPLLASTPATRQSAISYLHYAGRHVLFSRTAEMIRHGMVTAHRDSSTTISLTISDRASSDHFRDQIDHLRLLDINNAHEDRSTHSPIDVSSHLRSIAASLTFPWNTPQGTMVGYTADPEIDAHFLDVATRQILNWQREAGLHPSSRLPGCSGETLTAVVAVLVSFYIKHVLFVNEGFRLRDNTNISMSYTIWKRFDELVASLSNALPFLPTEEISAAIDLIKAGTNSHAHFLQEHTPYIPLLIEVYDGYLLSPVSGALRNPLAGIIRLQSQLNTRFEDAVRRERERWMVSDLYALFEGTRYRCIQGQARLRRNGKDITDIDAAIYDEVTGDLVLFQLKWQEFGTSIVRAQRSRASNFTKQVDEWGKRVCAWIDELGIEALCRSLRIRVNAERIRYVRLIAIGRSAARFSSYGYNADKQVLVLSWPQLVRLRIEIGPGADIFEELMHRSIDESNADINRIPLPHSIVHNGVTIIFRDIWNEFSDS